MVKLSLFVICVIAATTVNAKIDDWITEETTISYTKMYNNVQPAGTSKGCVIASPSTSSPNYYYQWVRDAAMTMKVAVNEYNTTRANDKTLLTILKDYADFSAQIQTAPSPCNCLGEPKFFINGTAFDGPWGRPQNDGPGIRATALIKFAYSYAAQTGDVKYVKNTLYNVIKTDLEYVSNHWQDTSFDLWEEVNGLHFFTLMVQRRALIDGAAFATYMDDSGAATHYTQESANILASIDTFWDSKNSLIQTTLNHKDGIDYKSSGLDAAQILGVLHGYAGDGKYSPSNDKVLATAYKLQQSFQTLYPINSKNPNHGTAIGRYPEDVYDGVGTSKGNPWILCTTAFAELYSKAALQYTQDGSITVTNNNLDFLKQFLSTATVGAVYKSKSSEFTTIIDGLNAGADDTFSTVREHINTDGSLGEEWDRNTGVNVGARDLTWSYAGFVTASLARSGTPAF